MRPKFFVPDKYAEGLRQLGYVAGEIHIITQEEARALGAGRKSTIERRAHGALRGRLNFDRFLQERKRITHEQLMELSLEEQQAIRAEYGSAGLQWHADFGEESA